MFNNAILLLRIWEVLVSLLGSKTELSATIPEPYRDCRDRITSEATSFYFCVLFQPVIYYISCHSMQYNLSY
jgi:hypothetical protein